MSDRTIQMAILVVLVAMLTLALLRLAVLPASASTGISTAVAALATTALGGVMLLIGKNGGANPKE